jgi:hypothetical protein
MKKILDELQIKCCQLEDKYIKIQIYFNVLLDKNKDLEIQNKKLEDKILSLEKLLESKE